MNSLERKKRKLWTANKIFSLSLLIFALIGFAFAANKGYQLYSINKQEKILKMQKKKLLEENAIFQDLLDEQNYSIIIADDGYCYDTSEKLIYKCQK